MIILEQLSHKPYHFRSYQLRQIDIMHEWLGKEQFSKYRVISLDSKAELRSSDFDAILRCVEIFKHPVQSDVKNLRNDGLKSGSILLA